MAVRSQQSFARFAVILQMKLMAYAVARLRIQNAVSLGNAFNKCMIIRIHEPCLKRVVIDVRN